MVGQRRVDRLLQARPVLIEPGGAGTRTLVSNAHDPILAPVEHETPGQIRLWMRDELLAKRFPFRVVAIDRERVAPDVRCVDQRAVAIEPEGEKARCA